MADDRPLETTEEAVGRIDGKIADLESTLLARLARRPTGDVELAFRGTPKPGTLFLQGQILNRADYPDLWAWAQASGSVVAGGYGAGDGTITFTLPDMRGRSVVGVGSNGTDTYALGQLTGAARVTLTTAQMPAHGHTASTGNDTHQHASDALHSHSISSDGGHAGHNSGATGTNASTGTGLSVATTTQNTLGGHSHGGGTGGAGAHSHDAMTHSHTVTVGSTGSGAAVDARPMQIAVNWAVWT